MKRVLLGAANQPPVNFPDSRIGASLKRLDGAVQALALATSPIRESGPH